MVPFFQPSPPDPKFDICRYYSPLHAAIQPYSETLLYSGFTDLNLAQPVLCIYFFQASRVDFSVLLPV
jgi:hypothetical protein